MIILKFIGLLVVATGSAIALFGEPRRDGRLTMFGWAALALVLIGLVVASTLEVLTVRSQTFEKRIAAEWQDTADQYILEVGLAVDLLDEMPYTQFVEYAGKIKVTLATYAGSRDGNAIVRNLSIKDLRLDSNLEKSVVLTSYSIKNELVGHGFGAKLKKLTPVDSMAMREPSKATYVDGHLTNLGAKVIGLEASMPWPKVGLPSDISSFGDISKIKEIIVGFPLDFNMDTIFRMDLYIVTSDQQLFFFNLANLQFHEIEARKMANIQGFDIISRFRDEFYKQGGRWPLRIVLK